MVGGGRGPGEKPQLCGQVLTEHTWLALVLCLHLCREDTLGAVHSTEITWGSTCTPLL